LVLIPNLQEGGSACFDPWSDPANKVRGAISVAILVKTHYGSEANFHFRGPRLYQIGGASGRFATTDVIQISTTRVRYIH